MRLAEKSHPLGVRELKLMRNFERMLMKPVAPFRGA